MVERIRTLLETRQLTPTQFADAIGIARPIVSHILSGRNKPSLEVVQRILAAMPDLSMPWLLNGTGPMLAGASSALAAPEAQPAAPVAPLQSAKSETINPAVVELPANTAEAQVNQAKSGASQPKSVPVAAASKADSPTARPAPKRFSPLAPKPNSAPTVATPELGVPPTITVPVVPPSPPAEAAPAPVPPPVANIGPEPADAAAAAFMMGTEKPIRRIVIFYRDGSFADYQPE